MTERTNERVEFRLLKMECCNHLLCWVNPRYPSYCPECGTMCYPQVRGWAVVIDNEATLRVKHEVVRVGLEYFVIP